jgi:hypothetical protein
MTLEEIIDSFTMRENEKAPELHGENYDNT